VYGNLEDPMLVKPLTSLAFCTLTAFVALPAHAAAPLEASGKATLVVSGSNVGPGQASATIVRVTHRPRKTLRKKPGAKISVHHAEPAKTPVVTAVVKTPLQVTKVSAVSKPHVVHHTRSHAKSEILIGPKVSTKIEVSPPKTPSVPAEIEVKTHGPQATVRPGGKVEVRGVKASIGIRPIARNVAVVDKPAAGSLAVDVGTGESKIVLQGESTLAKGEPAAKIVTKSPCLHDPIEFVRGQEVQSFSMTRCDGSIAPLALEKLSILARPESAALPKSIEPLAKIKGPSIAAGIRRVDPGLLLRIQTIAEHFAKSAPVKVSVVSGYRPLSSGSYHATAQAMDFRIEGVPNEAVVEFCKTLSDTGCGYYPNSSFVHVDVRQPGTGHVAWIDASGPGEAPRYVASWPPPPDPDVKSAEKLQNPIDKLDTELPPLPSDDHPPAPGVSATVAAPMDVAK
jgi:hypothetical protein